MRDTRMPISEGRGHADVAIMAPPAAGPMTWVRLVTIVFRAFALLRLSPDEVEDEREPGRAGTAIVPSRCRSHRAQAPEGYQLQRDQDRDRGHGEERPGRSRACSRTRLTRSAISPATGPKIRGENLAAVKMATESSSG